MQKEKKQYVEVDRPHIVKVYNHNMGGVDLESCKHVCYRIDIRPHRWYLRILYYLIDLSLVNCWLLYHCHLNQKQEKKYMPLLDFRVQVADALIKVGKQADLNSRKRGRPSLEDDPTSHQAAPPPLQRISAPSVDVRLDRCDHFPIHAEKRGRCRLCKNGYTQTACLKCKVLLCFTKDKNCFLEYHMTKWLGNMPYSMRIWDIGFGSHIVFVVLPLKSTLLHCLKSCIQIKLLFMSYSVVSV